MTDDPNTAAFWEANYREGQRRWELGGATPVFRRLAESGEFAPGRMIVPGAGLGDDAPTRVKLRYHYFYPHQYDLLFGLTGFRLLGLLGDYDDSRFDEDSERLIIVGEAE